MSKLGEPLACGGRMLKDSFFSQRGLSMLEALVAMLIVAIGILGAAGMLNMSVQNNMQANNRNHALYLGQAIVDKIKMNKFAVQQYLYNDSGAPFKSYTAQSYSAKSEKSASCDFCSSDAQKKAFVQASQDVNLWATELESKLPGAIFAIYRIGSKGSQYAVQIMWPNVADVRANASATANNTDELLIVFSL